MNPIDPTIYPIIGMSPGNSYFKDDEVKYLLKTVVERYGRVAIMIADVPAIATYIAFGYPPNIARREKAIPQGNLLKNRTKRAMEALGYTDAQVRILDWANEIEPNAEYQECYRKIHTLYETSEKFKHDADETTRAVLVASKREIPDIEQATTTAVHYLLSEFAFMEWAPKFLGVQKTTYTYHKNWPVFENYIAGIYDNVPKPEIHFLLMENPWETYRTTEEIKDEGEAKYHSNLERVETTKTLRVAFANYPPALIYDYEHDAFSGIFYEIIASIAKKHGWEIKWSEETGYGVVVDGLDHNRFDIFGSTVWPTPERKEKASFSDSLYTSKVYPWAMPNFDYEKMKENGELRVVVKENDISYSIAVADFPNARLVYVPQLADPQELLQFVADGKGDITFVEPYFAEHFMKTKNAVLVQATTEPIRVYENTFVFKKDDSSLRDLFNAEIKEMINNDKIGKLIQKYTGSKDTFK